ncbi:MAG: hypothetical protein ACK5LP_04735 [Campylobacteraceae bacterium]
MIDLSFLKTASDILADTDNGLSGTQLEKYLTKYSYDFHAKLPYPTIKSKVYSVSNKRTFLFDNLKVFKPEQQFSIINDLSQDIKFKNDTTITNLRINLFNRYGNLNQSHGYLENLELINETKHWLSDFPKSLKLYNESLEKLQAKVYERNTLDDIRLSLELLLKEIFNNDKSLENQKSDIGKFVKEENGSQEFSNMLIKLVDYFSKYQNEYIKHNDKVVKYEICFTIELASLFMKQLIKLNTQRSL